MAKIVPTKKIGVPVPTDVPPDTKFLTCYYGETGFTPSYDQEEQVDLEIADVEVVTVNGANFYKFDPSVIGGLDPSETYDLYFTLADEAGNENDFSPAIALPPFDQTPPPALGQPVLLDA